MSTLDEPGSSQLALDEAASSVRLSAADNPRQSRREVKLEVACELAYSLEMIEMADAG